MAVVGHKGPIMATPYKVTSLTQVEILRLWNERKTQAEIADVLGLHVTTVTNHLRKLFGVATPTWTGRGRVAVQRPPKPKEAPPAVVHPPEPNRLAFPCEFYPGEAARFWNRVAAPNERGCRLWLDSSSGNGAGQVWNGHTNEIAYHVAWRLTYGPIPKKKQLNHKCDVRLCCEPTHLWAGTQAQNLADMAAKGRAVGKHSSQRGEDNVTAVLTWALVRQMRKTREEQGLTYDELSAMFGISKAQVSNIITGKQWKEEPVPL